MKNIHYLALFLVLITSPVFSQTYLSLSGKVVNPDGEPLYPATIQVKGKTLGAATDFDGYFTIDNVTEDDTLQVRFIGYIAQHIPVGGRTFITITLRPSE